MREIKYVFVSDKDFVRKLFQVKTSVESLKGIYLDETSECKLEGSVLSIWEKNDDNQQEVERYF